MFCQQLAGRGPRSHTSRLRRVGVPLADGINGTHRKGRNFMMSISAERQGAVRQPMMNNQMIHFSDAIREPEGRPTQAWLVRSDGELHMHLFAVEMNVSDIIHILSNHYNQFEFTRVDVGSFVVSRTISSYSGDARWINQDGYLLVKS